MYKPTIAEITKLRQMTGAGLTDTKNALVEAQGNLDRAVELIRERGLAIANKRGDRIASEGVVLAMTTPCKKEGALFVLNCETDFVAKNADFVALVQEILQTGLQAKVKSLDELRNLKMANGQTVDTNVLERSGITGEKLNLAYWNYLQAEELTVYIHPGNRIAAILGVNKAGIDAQVLDLLPMHVAGLNPVAIDAQHVSDAVKQKELEIGREQARLEGKPANLVEKIAEGRLQKFLKESTLLSQPAVWDNTVTVGQYITQVDPALKVTVFDRYSLQD